MDDFIFEGIADAIRPEGFGAIYQHACGSIAAHYNCKWSVKEIGFTTAYRTWCEKLSRLPLNIYNPSKRNNLCVAVLIQAVSSFQVAEFSNEFNEVSVILRDFSNEIVGLMMGLILHDIALRTERNQRTKIHYVPIERLDGVALREAINVLRDKALPTHRRRFIKLLAILEQYRTPLTFH